MLKITDLFKHYSDGDGDPVRAVDGVTMTIEPGKIVALYGPSGSGKTTLLHLIAGVTSADAGSIIVNGSNVCEMSDKEREVYRLREIGLVSGHSRLLPGATVKKNATLRLVFAGELESRPIEPLLERLELSHRLEHKIEDVSSGERQRVLIAAALSTGPKLVLADEPTGNLDTERTQKVLALLRELARERNVAILLVTHDPLAAHYADQVYKLSDGRLGEYVPPDLSQPPDGLR